MTKDKQPAESGSLTAKAAAGGAVVCGKCGHENKPHSSRCVECGAHLHIVCHQCGHRNLRTASACVECGKRLHRSFWQRWSKRIFRRSPDLAPFQIGFLIVAVYVGYKVIIMLSRMNPPPPE